MVTTIATLSDKMAAQTTDAPTFSLGNCKNSDDEAMISYEEEQTPDHNMMDCVALCDIALESVDSLLETLSLSDSDLASSNKEYKTVCASTQTQFATPLSVQGFRAATSTTASQTSDDLISDTISAMEAELHESKCKLAVLTEHFKGMETGFRNDLSEHLLATKKAKADLEKSQQEMAKLQARLASLERVSPLEGGDSQVEEYKPELIQGYRPVATPTKDVQRHYFAGDTPPPAWAQEKQVKERSDHRSKREWHPHSRVGTFPPNQSQSCSTLPPCAEYDPSRYRASRDFGRIPPPPFRELGRVPSLPLRELGRVPSPPPHELGRVPSPEIFVDMGRAPFHEFGRQPVFDRPANPVFGERHGPPCVFMSPPPIDHNSPHMPHPVQTNVKAYNRALNSASNKGEIHKPGEIVVRPLTPENFGDYPRKVTFGVRETLYF